MDKSKLTKQKGQLLIEAMVAVSLMLVGLLGIFGVLSRSLGLSRVAADQFVAVNLASEGIEVAKNLIDKNYTNGFAWNAGFVGVGTVCLDYKSTAPEECSSASERVLYVNGEGLYEHGQTGNIQSKFSRELTITNPSADIVVVTSRVSWRGRGALAQSVVVEDHFYNWRRRGL